MVLANYTLDWYSCDMKILAIETSCDETSICILTRTEESYYIHAHVTDSQIEIHKEYGGVFPALAKRAHAENIPHVLERACIDAGYTSSQDSMSINDHIIHDILADREPELSEKIVDLLKRYDISDIDTIVVTHGPGLEPALWIGVNVARALAAVLNTPIVPVHHMEGHIVSAEIHGTDLHTSYDSVHLDYPTLALLISGGHTEFIYMENSTTMKKIGATRDDAVGEAFDKVARMMDIDYPGGPELENIAQSVDESPHVFPRPMLRADTYDMSFSGLKTAIRYALSDMDALSDLDKAHISHAFHDAVSEVLCTKIQSILEDMPVATVVLGGGVSANKIITERIRETVSNYSSDIPVHIPHISLATDNALMIAYAGYNAYQRNEYIDPTSHHLVRAQGNLSW